MAALRRPGDLPFLHGEADSLMVLQSRRANNDFTLQFELRWAEEPPALRLELEPGNTSFQCCGRS